MTSRVVIDLATNTILEVAMTPEEIAEHESTRPTDPPPPPPNPVTEGLLLVNDMIAAIDFGAEPAMAELAGVIQAQNALLVMQQGG